MMSLERSVCVKVLMREQRERGSNARPVAGATSTGALLKISSVALLLAERFDKNPSKFNLDEIQWKDALLIGLFQCLALWPGTSRAAATIIGAMLIGVDRKTSVEYSFFAAVPVITAASLYDIYKNCHLISGNDAMIFAAGFITAFISAWISVRFFVKMLSHLAITAFGWYRIAIAPFVYFFVR
jgi:undecaprenyl-diphosphatase